MLIYNYGKRSVDNILKETLPHKSKEDYLKAWKQFKEYIGEDRRPNEEDYIQYFDCLRGDLVVFI